MKSIEVHIMTDTYGQHTVYKAEEANKLIYAQQQEIKELTLDNTGLHDSLDEANQQIKELKRLIRGNTKHLSDEHFKAIWGDI